MVITEPSLYNLVSKIVKKQYKNIPKKKITLFYHQLYKLIKFSKIFTHNCHNNSIFIQDINASLLTLGIKPIKHQLGGYQEIFNGFCNKEMDRCSLKQTAGNIDTNNVYDGYCGGETSQCKVIQNGGDYDGYCGEETSQCKVIQSGGDYDGYCGGEKTQCISAIGGKKTKKKKTNKRPTKRLKDYKDECLFEKDAFNKIAIDFSKLNSNIEAKFTSNSLYYLNAVSKYMLEQIIAK